MRVGVVGAGAIGAALAALLSRVGDDVTVTARGANLAAIREHGVVLTGAWGDVVARVRAVETLEERPDLALVTVKAQDAEAAVRASAAALAGVPTVVVQNGLGGPRALHELLPATPLIGGLALFAAEHLEPGRARVTGPAPTVLAGDTATRAEVRRAAEALERAVPVEMMDDLLGAQWSKLVLNQLNAAPAVTGLPMQLALASPLLMTAVVAAMRETVRVGRRGGVRFPGLPGLPAARIRLLGALPPPVSARLLRERLTSGMGAVPNLGSTLQSIRRGAPSEIDHLSGAVVVEGARLGVRTPVNRRVVDLVHEVAAQGRFLPPDAAAGRLLR